MKWTGVWLMIFLCGPVQAGIRVVDDAGHAFEFDQPVTRIVSLSPHITELLFAAGATHQLKGTVSFSDYPAAAKQVPLIGSYNRFDVERIAALKPQIIIAWQSGNPASQVELLKQLGVPVFYSEPKELSSIADSLKQFGVLLGTSNIAQPLAEQFSVKLQTLRDHYANKQSVSVFYQVWHQPLMTINGEHLISKIITLCGGANVFADMSALVPQVDTESVLLKNPQAIIVGLDEAKKELMYDWQQWPQLDAVKNKRIFYVDSDNIARHTPRILQGASSICQQLERVRAGSPSAGQ
jgi:iron complex transport system substrate-binding protein